MKIRICWFGSSLDVDIFLEALCILVSSIMRFYLTYFSEKWKYLWELKHFRMALGGSIWIGYVKCHVEKRWVMFLTMPSTMQVPFSVEASLGWARRSLVMVVCWFGLPDGNGITSHLSPRVSVFIFPWIDALRGRARGQGAPWEMEEVDNVSGRAHGADKGAPSTTSSSPRFCWCSCMVVCSLRRASSTSSYNGALVSSALLVVSSKPVNCLHNDMYSCYCFFVCFNVGRCKLVRWRLH